MSLHHSRRPAIPWLGLVGLAAGLAVWGGCPIGPAPNGDNGGNGSGDDDPNDVQPPPTTVTVEAIARTGDPVPGQDNATFTYFGNPIIDDDGRVAFHAAYAGGRGGGGLYVWQDGTLQRIYDTDPVRTDPVPGRAATDRFAGLTVRWDRGSPHLAWGSNGRLLFAAQINENPQPNIVVRWRARDGDLFLVGDDESLQVIIPDASGDFLPEYYHPGVSDAGIAIFSNRYSFFREDGTFSFFNLGIFTTDGRTTQEIGVGSVPGQAGSVTFAHKPVLLTTHNARGDFLFQAEYESTEGDRGVYRLRDDQLTRVVDNAPNRSFPGLPAAAQVGVLGENFAAIAISSQGHIAIDTTLTVGGATRDVVLLWNGIRWRELQDSDGGDASDLLAGVSDDGETLYLVDGQPFLGDGESTVSVAATLPSQLSEVDLTWETFGGAINNHGRTLLRYRRQDPDASGLAFWSGEQLFVVLDGTAPTGLDAIDVIFSEEQREPDALDRVGTISDRPDVNRPGLSGMINDRDEWVLRAGALGADGLENTDDDAQAIFFGRAE